MNFEIIQTERLQLKGLSPDNLKNIFEQLPKAEIKKLLGLRTEEDFLLEEKKFHNRYSINNKSFMLFLMVDKATESIIGRGGLHNWNADHNRAELGYVMEDELYKRKGLMSEAVGAFIHYGFSNMELHRIEALVGVENIPSLKIIEKYKFTREGLLRQHYKVDGNFEDSIIFSLLHEEYKNRTKD